MGFEVSMELTGFDDDAKGVGFVVAVDKAGIEDAGEVASFGVANEWPSGKTQSYLAKVHRRAWVQFPRGLMAEW